MRLLVIIMSCLLTVWYVYNTENRDLSLNNINFMHFNMFVWGIEWAISLTKIIDLFPSSSFSDFGLKLMFIWVSGYQTTNQLLNHSYGNFIDIIFGVYCWNVNTRTIILFYVIFFFGCHCGCLYEFTQVQRSGVLSMTKWYEINIDKLLDFLRFLNSNWLYVLYLLMPHTEL